MVGIVYGMYLVVLGVVVNLFVLFGSGVVVVDSVDRMMGCIGYVVGCIGGGSVVERGVGSDYYVVDSCVVMSIAYGCMMLCCVVVCMVIDCAHVDSDNLVQVCNFFSNVTVHLGCTY